MWVPGSHTCVSIGEALQRGGTEKELAKIVTPVAAQKVQVLREYYSLGPVDGYGVRYIHIYAIKKDDRTKLAFSIRSGGLRLYISSFSVIRVKSSTILLPAIMGSA